MDILEELAEARRLDAEARAKRVQPGEMERLARSAPPARGFAAALRRARFIRFTTAIGTAAWNASFPKPRGDKPWPRQDPCGDRHMPRAATRGALAPGERRPAWQKGT